MGGTFDILHVGHKNLLARASLEGDEVLVGLTTDEKARVSRESEVLNSYEVRKENLESYLNSEGFLEKFIIVPLNNDWGPSVIDKDFDAIVVSEETKKTADKINSIRASEGKNQLSVIVVPLVLADDGQLISSSRIRKQEIDSKGKLT
tara:strand:- start:966 stop:1409 length:444 start_codon:yes stop_codon:yes gene_type:complete